MRYIFFCIISLLIVYPVHAQVADNQCNNAGVLCPQTTENITNANATITFCPSCEDDFTLCFTPLNTIWLTFQTNAAGGDASLIGLNLNFDPTVNNNNNSINLAVFEAAIPCNAASYSEVACLTNQSTAFSLGLTALAPNTTYYVVISGTQNGPGALQPSQLSMDIRISGPAVNRPPASIVFGALPTVACSGDPVLVVADTTFCPEIDQYNWYLNDEFWFSTPTNAVYVDTLKNGDFIRVEATCFADCPVQVTSNTVTLTILNFEVNAGADVEIYAGESVILSGSTTGVNYYWLPAMWLNDPNSLNPIAFPEETTTFFLTATNGVCERTDEMVVTVNKNLTIPTVFSPNGDGINDRWEILGTARFPNMKVEIMDRWGQKVFETVGYNEQKWWDGTHRGKPVATSTYYYVIDLNDNSVDERVLKGAVSVVR
jgi:gliding motility-associated-like protein